MTASEVLRGPGCLSEIPAFLKRAGSRSVLVLCGPSRRHLDRLLPLLGPQPVIFDEARTHVPADVIARAQTVFDASGADTIIALGGGAATGLGKLLRRGQRPTFVAIPTTFSGSEMTAIWGATEDGKKVTGRDPAVRPDLVVYDAQLLSGMPRELAVPSGLNALAHPISALSTGELSPELSSAALAAVTQLLGALRDLLSGGDGDGVNDRLLRGCELAGCIIDGASLGVHHRVAHLLGARFDLPHSGVHSVLLPHFAATLRAQPALWLQLVAASGEDAPDGFIQGLLEDSGAPASLGELGVSAAQLEALEDRLDSLGSGVSIWVNAALARQPSASPR